MSIEQDVHRNHRVTEWETREVGQLGENPIVASAEVYQGTRSWARDRKMVEGAEETSGRYCHQLFEPSDYRDPAIGDVNAVDEDVETANDEGGIEICEFRHRCEVFQG